MVFLPPSFVPLPGNTVSFADADALTDEAYCYIVMAVGGTPPLVTNFLGFSDFLCLYPGGATGAPATNLKVQLNQGPTATLNWSAPGGQTGYDLVVSTFDGQGPQTIGVDGALTSTMHHTGGQSTCYELRAKQGAKVTGVANRVCAVPGI